MSTSNYRAVAKENITSPLRAHSSVKEIYSKARDLKKGYSVEVAHPSTGSGIENSELVGALLLDGFSKEEAERYVDGSPENHFDVKECGPFDSKLYHKQFEAQTHRADYSVIESALKKAQKDRESAEKEAKEARKSEKGKSSSCCNCGCSCCGSICECLLGLLPPPIRCLFECCC